jgi:hypothetical protein
MNPFFIVSWVMGFHPWPGLLQGHRENFQHTESVRDSVDSVVAGWSCS